MPDIKSIGSAAENQAIGYLQQHGLRILQKNYRCKGGEIDIIAQDGCMVVFVEVRSRAVSVFGGAAESITLRKQRRIILAARHYLMKAKTTPMCRFDAILLDGNRLTWEKDCFQVR